MPAIDGSHAGRRVAEVLRAIDTNQPPFALRSPVSDMLAAVAPYAPFWLRGVCSRAAAWSALVRSLQPLGCFMSLVGSFACNEDLPTYVWVLDEMRV